IESPSGLPARMVLLLTQPLDPAQRPVRLRMPIDGTAYFLQEAEAPYRSIFPTPRLSFDDYLVLTAEGRAGDGHSWRISYRVTEHSGAVHTGIGADWSEHTQDAASTAQPN